MSNNKKKRLCAVIGASLIALLIFSCAGKAKGVTADAPAGDGSEIREVEGLTVNPTDTGTQISISVDGPAAPRGYLLKDPPRVIVDIPVTKLSKSVEKSYTIDNDLVSDVTVVSIGSGDRPMTRVVVFLKSEADYTIEKEDGRVLLNVGKPDDSAVAEAPETAGKKAPEISDAKALPEEKPQVATGPTALPFGDPIPVETGASEVDGLSSAEEADVAPEDSFDVAYGEKAGETEEESAAEPVSVEEPTLPADRYLPEATRVTDISTSTENGLVKVTIETNGAVGSFDAFTLPSPPRIVVDLAKLKTDYPFARLNVGEGDVKTVRIGKHPDKIRIVIDLEDSLASYSTYKSGENLYILVGDGAEEAAPKPKAPVVEPINGNESPDVEEAPPAPRYLPSGDADVDDTASDMADDDSVWGPTENTSDAPSYGSTTPPPELPDETPPELPDEAPPGMSDMAEQGYEPVNVTAVSFDWTPEKSTVTINTTGRGKYEVVTNARDYLLSVRISDATIPPTLERSLDTSEFNGPIRMVSSYQWATGDTKDVYVTLTLNYTSEYYVARDGNDIIIVMENPEGAQMGVSTGRAEYAAPSGTPGDDEMITEEGVGRGGAQYYGGVGGSVRRNFSGRLVYLDYQQISVADALSLLAEVANLNLIVSADVQGNISLKLEAVPWDQALDIILRTQELGGVIRGNILRVASLQQLEEEERKAMERIQKRKKINEPPPPPIELRILFVSYADPNDIADKIKSMVTSPGGNIVVDERTSSILVWEIKDNLDAIEKLVSRLDVETPQVLIEARIVEARTSFSKDLGVNWGIGYHRGAAYGSKASPWNFPGTMDVGVGLVSGIGAAGAADAAMASESNAVGITLGSLTGAVDLDLILRASELENDAKVVSSPRILTLDNEAANITQGTAIPFATTSAAGTQTEFVDANLKIDVTPHVTSDGRIFMELTVQNNTPDYTVVGATGPGINKSEAQTQILIKDGETMVIGGIYVHDMANSEARTPILGKLPFLKWLFRDTAYDESRRELLIFLTPRIVSGGDQYLRSVKSKTAD